MMAAVLEDTILQFRVLEDCNNRLRLLKAKKDMGILVAKKYGIEEKYVKKPNIAEAKYYTKEEHKLDKIESDRKFIMDTIRTTYAELLQYRSFESLKKCVVNIDERDNKLSLLSGSKMKNKAALNTLARQRRFQRNNIKSTYYEINSVIEDLKTQVKDTVIVSQVKARYVDKWQSSRTEQNLYNIDITETTAADNIAELKQKIDNEQRIHSEIEMIVNITINEILGKLDKILTKYDADLEDMELKIKLMRHDYQDAFQERTELERTLKKNEEECRKWIEFKQKREADRLREVNMNRAATAVQVWWRGLLVRLRLGPFKPVVKKRKKLKKKKMLKFALFKDFL